MGINHDIAAHRFTLDIDGERGVLDYILSDGALSGGKQSDAALHDRVMTIVHTGVPPPIGGRGIASELTRAALDVARREGWKVVPACSYAAAFLRRHPEYADLLA